MSERKENFKKWLVGRIGYTLKNDDINYIMSFVDELFNINDKLSSALNSAEQKINKAIEYINTTYWYEDMAEEEEVYFKDGFGVDKLLSILQGKE